MLELRLAGLWSMTACVAACGSLVETDQMSGGDQWTEPVSTTGDLETMEGPSQPVECMVTAPCDHLSDDPWQALGLNCPGGPQVMGSISATDSAQVYVHTGNLGTYVDAAAGPPFAPREGEKTVILSSGDASHLLEPPTDAKGPSTTFSNMRTSLPPPIRAVDVAGSDDCLEHPSLVGTGDCSRTIQGEMSPGEGVYDYVEMRMVAQVPDDALGFTFDFAFFTVEYPDYYVSQYNDIFITWLESEIWTGNIAFDELGSPISVNSSLLEYKDGPNVLDCPEPCEAPELQGTGVEGHAGTRWLTTQAPVMPGETIQVIFAIFDLSDSIFDSMVMLDNVQWCEWVPLQTR
jgi:hypothetical protein